MDANLISTLKIDTSTRPSGSPAFGHQGRPKGRGRKVNKKQQALDQETFDDDLDAVPDFDFVGNLAQFDKAKVFAEFAGDSETAMDESELLVTHNLKGGPRRRGPEPKMGIHEMVLDLDGSNSEPAAKLLPEIHGERFRTEHGISVPAISWDQMRGLISAADDIGMARAQIDENAGTSVCQMIVSLLGGMEPLLIIIGHNHSTFILPLSHFPLHLFRISLRTFF